MGNGISLLYGVIAKQLVPGAMPGKAMQDWADYGEIQADLSLKVRGFADPYPVGQYGISRLLTQLLIKPAHLATPITVSTVTVGDHGDHTHVVTVTVPDIDNPFGPLVAGDQVLVVWLNGSTDPIVVDVIDWPVV
jgi:hypothetical protein